MKKVWRYHKLSVRSSAIALIVLACNPGAVERVKEESETQGGQYKFHVLYPQPTDTLQFNLDYSRHLNLLDSLMGYTQDKPYYVTKMDREAFGFPSPFYQMFTMSFETREALESTLYSSEMEEAGKDAMSISSGGAPVVLIGNDE